MSKELDNIIKEELMRDIYIEADDKGKGKKLQSPKKFGGLINLGKTCFINQADVDKAKEFAQTQMLQKFGDEMYGISAAQSTIHSNKSSSGDDGTGTGQGSVTTGMGGLINCTVSPFSKMPKKFFESGNFNNFKTAWNEFEKLVNGKLKDDKWKSSHGDSWKKISELRQEIRERDPSASNYFKKIQDILSQKPWKDDTEFKKPWEKVQKGWSEYSGGEEKKQASGGTSDSGGLGKGGSDWIPEMTWKIDVVTHFDDAWFQRKFKSGLLNKAIMAVKTSARARQTTGSMKDHKYTANEMLPQDKRKLDGIQWKMTNQVAKAYITYLLGYVRDKQYKMKDDKPVPVQQDLVFDQGVGSSFAKKALSNRGILGRMVQKVFAGGQANNVISVVFQAADPNDGWKLVEEDKNNDNGGNDKGTPITQPAGGNDAGSSEKQDKNDVPKEVVSGLIDKNGEGGDGRLNLLQRVQRAEKEVYGKEQDDKYKDKNGKGEENTKSDKQNNTTNENTIEVQNGFLKIVSEDGKQIFESERYRLVKDICLNKSNVDKLVDNCIIGKLYN